MIKEVKDMEKAGKKRLKLDEDRLKFESEHYSSEAAN